MVSYMYKADLGEALVEVLILIVVEDGLVPPNSDLYGYSNRKS